MTSLNGATSHAANRHSHRTQVETEHCPLCGSRISAATRARLDEKLSAQLAKAEQTLRDQFDRQQQQASAKAAAEVAKAKADAVIQVEKSRREANKTAAAALVPKIAEAVTQAVAAERTKAYGERMKLDAQLADLQRQLQRRTANELGDEGEIDLFDALMTAFPQDQIARTPKGVEGGDVVQRVFFNGVVIGSLIYEAKNHRRWMSKWPSKLRQDQLTAGASFAVLVTTVFPSAAQQLAVVDEVIVASPARAIAVAHILRRMVIETHRLRLSNEARESKTERLFAFLVSDRAADFWKQIETATTDMVDLDRAETTAHQKVWAKRAELARTIIAARDDLAGTVDGIVRGDPDDLP